jgi:hypothetical protein
MSEAVRQAFEQKVLSGEQLSAPKIRRARGRLKGGSPNRRQPDQPARMGIAAFPLTSARAPPLVFGRPDEMLGYSIWTGTIAA